MVCDPGVFLHGCGQHTDALELAEEPTDTYRYLAGSDTQFRDDLAAAVSNLGNRLVAASRLDEALTATEEAVTIRRDLVATNPQRYLRDLAGSLNNLAVRHASLGQSDPALVAAQEAVMGRRSVTPGRRIPLFLLNWPPR